MAFNAFHFFLFLFLHRVDQAEVAVLYTEVLYTDWILPIPKTLHLNLSNNNVILSA